MQLYYYSHRFTSHNPAVQVANLERARERLEALRSKYRERDIHLWAPWIDMAIAGTRDVCAWQVIGRCLDVSHGVLLDLDGSQLSRGMAREQHAMVEDGGTVETER
jgi:hypothetical protein